MLEIADIAPHLSEVEGGLWASGPPRAVSSHGRRRGVPGRLLESALGVEATWIERGHSLLFGASCLAVARA